MKTSASFRTLRYSGSVLGVDLGTHTIKVLQLRVNGRRATVAAYAQCDVSAALADAKTDDARRDVYARALRDLLKKGRFKGKGAAIALSGNFSIARFLKLPKNYKRDARSGVPDEAKGLSPFDAQDTLLDARVIDDPTLEPGQAEVMVVIAQRKATSEALKIVQRARLRAAVVINDALALENAFSFVEGSIDEPAVLVDLGASTTCVAVVEAGALRAARTFNIAGEALTRALKREFGVSQEEAEALKREYGLHGHGMAGDARFMAGGRGASEAHRIYNDTAVRVYKALKPSIKELCVGIQRTIESFNDKRGSEQAPAGRILLAGGGADMKGLAEVMRAETGLPVELFTPLPRSVLPHLGEDENATSAPLAVVFGLGLAGALRQLSTRPRLNLLPADAKRAAAARNAGRVLLLLVLAAGGIFTGHNYYDAHMARLAQEEVAAEAELKAKAAKKKPTKAGVAASPAKAPRPATPFAFLARLKVAGAFSDVVMLTGAGSEYTARAGRVFDENGKPVPGATSVLGPKTVVLRGGGESYTLELPK